METLSLTLVSIPIVDAWVLRVARGPVSRLFELSRVGSSYRHIRSVVFSDSLNSKAWELDAPRLLVSLLKRATEPVRSTGRGIRPTHAHPDNGEDLYARPNTRRSAGKWDTEQSNFQQQTPPGQRCWCSDLLQRNDRR